MGEGVAMRRTCNRRVEDAEEVGPPRGGPLGGEGLDPSPLHCFAPADSTRESALVASGERYALTEAVEVVMIRQVEVVMIRLDRGQVHVEHPRPWD